MAYDTIVLSPEYNDTGRGEAPAVGSVIKAGALIEYTTGGVKVATTLLASSGMIATENIAVASDNTYEYAIGENVFHQALPRGVLVKARAVAATYADGAKLEIGAAGELQAVTTGVAVAVVPDGEGATVGVGGGLQIVRLL